MDHVTGVIAAIAPNDSVERFERLGVRVLKEEARFVGRTELQAGPHRIRSRRIVLATGSRPTAPPIPGLADVPYLTNETIFANRTLPGHLIVIGGGPIGLEMAQAHRRLGARVTVLEAVDFLAKDDPELCRHRRGAPASRRRRPARATSKIARVERAPPGIAVILDGGERLEGSHLLVAAGRAPDRRGPRPRQGRHRPHQARHHGRCARCAPPTATSGRSATATASMPSPTWRATRRRCSSAARCSARPRGSMPRSCRGRPIPIPSWPRSA